MLIQFSVANFRSFREEQTLSMVGGSDPAHPENLHRENYGLALCKVASLYGANGSGKSNFIKAIKAMESFVLNSATRMNLGDQVHWMSPFRPTISASNKPSRFEITLMIKGDTYIYGFSATVNRVHDEWLSVRRGKTNRISKWLERKYDEVSDQTTWEFRGPLKKGSRLLQDKTRENGLVLSRAAELNIDAVSDLFLWFRKSVLILDLSIPPKGLAQRTVGLFQTGGAIRGKIIQLMRDADFGISGMEISEEKAVLEIPSELPPPVREALSSLRKFVNDQDLLQYSVHILHGCDGEERPARFDLERDESMGTQRFFALVGPILNALERGDLLVIDELDCSMHPLLTRRVIELFQSLDSNENGAQLIFSTHDSSVMDATIFRRDQIWLTEKNSFGATDLFSLYDFKNSTKPRKDSALERNYLSGRYGGVPNFGPSFEDLELQ